MNGLPDQLVNGGEKDYGKEQEAERKMAKNRRVRRSKFARASSLKGRLQRLHARQDHMPQPNGDFRKYTYVKPGSMQ